MSKILEIRGCLPSQINRREWGDRRSRLGEDRAFCLRGGGALSLPAVDTVTPDTSLLLVRKGGEGVNWGTRGRASPWQMKHDTQLPPRLERKKK